MRRTSKQLVRIWSAILLVAAALLHATLSAPSLSSAETFQFSDTARAYVKTLTIEMPTDLAWDEKEEVYTGDISGSKWILDISEPHELVDSMALLETMTAGEFWDAEYEFLGDRYALIGFESYVNTTTSVLAVYAYEEQRSTLNLCAFVVRGGGLSWYGEISFDDHGDFESALSVVRQVLRSIEMGNHLSAEKTLAIKAPAFVAQHSEAGYATDGDGYWIGDADALRKGLVEFAIVTGVQPYVYILPNGQTTSTNELAAMAEGLYDQLFEDEGHFLLVFCDDGYGGYNCGYCMGLQATAVMDDEAVGVLADYLERYYGDYSISEEEIFSLAFSETATWIACR